jgi:hypothetical protein
MSKLSIYNNIMHSFISFCYMLHIFLPFYLQSVISMKELPFIGKDEMLWDPTIFFLLPSYVEAQALVLKF